MNNDAQSPSTYYRRASAKRLILCAVLLSKLLYSTFAFAQIVGTGQLTVERRSHTATLLQDGRVLIVGGDNQNGMVGQAEIFDPVSQTSALAAALITARTDHSAIRLSDGRVLAIGGRDNAGLLQSTEIYNPLTISFVAGSTMMRARSGHTATMLSDGKILVSGGDLFGSAEIYDPVTQSFSLAIGRLKTPRKFHSAILLQNGQVMIVGGVNAQDNVLNTAEVFDPASQSFYLPPTDMQMPRAFATLKLLPDAKVQIIGGDAELSMEVFDPSDGIFIAKALLPPNADLLGATLSTQSRAALFSPLVSQDSLLQGVLTAEQLGLLDRADQSITELPSRNQALVAGGVNSTGQVLKSAKLVSSSAASVTTDKTDYAPGQIVTITASDFQPNEQVDIYFHEFPEEYPDVFLSATANQQGNFVVAEFAPQEIDRGRIFTLTAIGQSSGLTAQTVFKDNHTMTVSCSPDSISIGSSIACTGTIGNGSGGQPASGRTITFASSGSGGFSSATCVTSGTNATASCAVNYNPSAVGTGTHRITGSFSFSAGGHANSKFFDVTVQKANQTITFSALVNKVYGDSDFTLSATASSGLMVGFSSLTSATCTISSNTVHIVAAGACTIRASQGGDSNYNAAPDVDRSFTINKASPTLNWNDPADITYGTALSSTQFNATATAVVNGSTVNLAGVFTYTPSSGTILNAGNNQNLHVSFAPTDITNYNTPVTNYVIINVLKKDATWTTNAASKTYGDADPSPLTTGTATGFLATDGVTATYSRAAGENASPPTYHITAILSATMSGALNNYNITNDGTAFTINKRPASVTSSAASKIYGDADPALSGTLAGFLFADGVTASYSRTAGETVGTYTISATLSPAGVLGNYEITYNTALFTINKRPITVIADAKSKTYGQLDPALSYQVTRGSLAFSDTFTGALSRVPGELVGTYAIQQNTLSITNVSNYTFTYIGANLTIMTGFAFDGFHSPIGGSVENGNGGNYADPLKTFKLGSTIPVKFGATWLNGGAALITGIHTLQAVKYNNATDSAQPIDATPTDAATSGNQFRLTTTDWHFNLSTKANEFSAGTWLLIATLEDGSKYSVWISIKK